MKKGILAVILIISAVFCAFGQNSDTIDLVLLLDTSSAMGSSYERVNDYITGTFLSEFLRVGDTFHLITFSAAPRLDIARRVTARGDIETIIGRMLIQYPVENGNNAGAAINYVESYISTLPPRPKKIVMVSSGGPEINNVVSAAKQRLSSKNATLDFVSVTGGQPIANPPSSGRSSPSRQAASQQAASPGTTGTAASGAASTRATGSPSTPSTGTAPAQGAAGTQSTTREPSQTGGQAAQGSSQAGGPAVQGSSQTGGQATTGSSQTDGQAARPSTAAETTPDARGASPSDDRTVSEKSGSPDRDSAAKESPKAAGTAKKEYSGFSPSMPLIAGIIAALLLLLLLIIFASRRLGSSPNRVMATVSALGGVPEKEDRFKDHSNDLANYAANQSKKRVTPYSDRPIKPQVYSQPTINPSGPLLLNLFVEDQNTAIGKRNIHSLKSGYSLSFGGGKSDDFYIFLVPLPPRLGEIRRSGSQLTFIPRKPKYFPDIGSNEVRDCINKKIRIISDKNYEMWFSFVMYEDPLIALNRVLHSIKVPG